MSPSAKAAILSAIGMFSGVVARGQSFATVANDVRGVSDDGRAATGRLLDLQTRRFSYRWTADAGVQRIGLDPVFPGGNTSSVISGDGNRVFGTANGFGMYRYDGPGQLRLVPTFGFYQGGVGITDANRSGSAAVGALGGELGAPGEAFRWTDDGGVRGLGWTRPQTFVSEAWGVSADGGVVVGRSYGFDDSDAFVWTASAGMTALQTLPGSSAAGAFGVSSNGRIIVGWCGLVSTACFWNDGVIEALSTPQGFIHSVAKGLSDDGSIIVGQADIADRTEAAVWSRDFGAETLTAFFAHYGITLDDGKVFSRDVKVSADGLTFVGSYGRVGSTFEGYVITIPNAGTLGVVGAGLFALKRRRS